MASHSSMLAWEIPWTEHPGGIHKELDMTQQLNDNKESLGKNGDGDSF